jgi:hypothetical protein
VWSVEWGGGGVGTLRRIWGYRKSESVKAGNTQSGEELCRAVREEERRRVRRVEEGNSERE